MMKKVLQRLLVMGAAAVISVGASSYAADAATAAPTGIKASNYKVDYANQRIQVIGLDGNTKLYVAKATVTEKVNKASGNKTMTVKTAAATEYDAVTNMYIDISSYAVTKDIYLSIWGNKTTVPTLIKLPAATTKMKAVVNPVDFSVQINNTTDSKNPVEISGTEYCTTNGNWADYTTAAAGKTAATTAKTTTVKLDDYAQLGATLRFRVKASAAAALPAATEIGTDANGNKVMACVGTGNFASNEVKAKVAKTAAGPKATIDYAKKTIKIPNTTEYRIQEATKTLNPFVAAATTEKTMIIDFATLKSTAAKPADMTKLTAELDLRTAATEKKPASKITEYTFPAVGTITAQTMGSKGAAAIAITSDISASLIKDEDVKVTGVTWDKKNTTATVAIESKNTNDKFEFVVADAQSVALTKLELPTVNTKVNGTLAAATVNAKTGVLSAKTAKIKVKAGQFVYVRKAANTKKGAEAWSTPYVFFGVATAPEAAVATK